jgi:hypothetical protein
LSGLILAACQPSREVKSELVLPERGERLVATSTQRFIFPGELGALTMPTFPGSHPLRASADVTVCVSFTVDEGGGVVDARPESMQGMNCADALSQAAFVEESLRTVLTWEFIAAALCDYDTAALKDEDGDDCARARQITPLPIRLAWTFRFIADQAGRRVQSER